MLSKMCMIRNEKAMEFITIFVNHNQELFFQNTVSNTVMGKLASVNKS